MIVDITNKLMKYVIMIACVSMVITWAFGIQNMLITESTYNGITIKNVDFRQYLQNIQNAWSTKALNFESIIPSRTIQNTNNFVSDISNNLLTIFDWLYFPINFILYILRWICWILKLGLALIGWNVMKKVDQYGYPTDEYYSTLIKILEWITENLFIPYV